MSTDQPYTPDEAEVREVWVDDRISRDPGQFPHGEAHVPEVEAEFDRFISRVRRDAEFIAASRTAAPALLDALEAAKHRATRAEARIKAVRDVHYPAHNDQDRTPFCETCKGAPGVHECGCWQDEQQVPVCGHCRGWKGVGSVEWPCPTIRALDGSVTPPRAE